MAGDIVSDSYTDSAATLLENHTGETGASWTKHTDSDGSIDITSGGTGINALVGGTKGLYYASGVPPSADYEVVTTLNFVDTDGANESCGVCGRMSTAEETMYLARLTMWDDNWHLYRFADGSATELGEAAAGLGGAQAYTLKLEMIGSAIKVYVDSVEKISVTDSTITDKGRVGVRMYSTEIDGWLTQLDATNLGSGLSILIAQRHYLDMGNN